MKKNKYLRVLTMTFLVILGISGIGWVTWHLGQIFVGLVSNTSLSEEEKGGQTSAQILNLPKITLWTCQAGVYKDRRNADKMVESLSSKGWKAAAIQEEPYTIAIGAFNTKERALLQGDVLAEDGIETWVKEESFPALSYKVSGKNAEKITVLLKLTNALLSGKEKNAVKAELAGDTNFFIAGGYPSDFEKLNTTLSMVLSRQYQDDERKGLYHQDLLDLYLDYKIITTKYLKNYK